MANFAIIENDVVINTIVAENIEIAQEVTGKNCVEYTESNPAIIGLGYSKGVFEQPVRLDAPSVE